MRDSSPPPAASHPRSSTARSPPAARSVELKHPRTCSARCALLPEVNGAVAPTPKLADQIVQRPDGGLELGGTYADKADEVRVAPTVGPVAEAPDQLRDARVLALLAAAVERLDGDHAIERRLALVVVAEPNRRPTRMAGQGDAAEPGDLRDQLLGREADVGEIEAGEDVAVDAVDQHVAVVGLHLGGVEDEKAVPVLERPVVARRVELAVLGEHDAVERALGALALEHLQVRLDERAAVVRELGVEMQVEDHALRTARSAAEESRASDRPAQGLRARGCSASSPLSPASSTTSGPAAPVPGSPPALPRSRCRAACGNLPTGSARNARSRSTATRTSFPTDESRGNRLWQPWTTHVGSSPSSIHSRRRSCRPELRQAGRNLGRVISAVTSSNTTSTGMPMRTSPGAQPTRLVRSLGPSSSSTMAST